MTTTQINAQMKRINDNAMNLLIARVRNPQKVRVRPATLLRAVLKAQRACDKLQAMQVSGK